MLHICLLTIYWNEEPSLPRFYLGVFLCIDLYLSISNYLSVYPSFFDYQCELKNSYFIQWIIFHFVLIYAYAHIITTFQQTWGFSSSFQLALFFFVIIITIIIILSTFLHSTTFLRLAFRPWKESSQFSMSWFLSLGNHYLQIKMKSVFIVVRISFLLGPFDSQH